MRRSYSFWKNLPRELKFAEWPDLITALIVNGIAAVALGIIIGGLFGWQIGQVGILNGCIGGILIFAILGFCEHFWHFFRFLYYYSFDK
jgi:vacuolar-type H+-ATPase subunit I/STV1